MPMLRPLRGGCHGEAEGMAQVHEMYLYEWIHLGEEMPNLQGGKAIQLSAGSDQRKDGQART